MSDITPEQVAALRALLADAPSGLCYDEADEDAECPHGQTEIRDGFDETVDPCPARVALDRWGSHFTAMALDALPALLDAVAERDAAVARAVRERDAAIVERDHWRQARDNAMAAGEMLRAERDYERTRASTLHAERASLYKWCVERGGDWRRASRDYLAEGNDMGMGIADGRARTLMEVSERILLRGGEPNV